ncbi:MAG: phospholipid/cholesterol/gamma-HCH transport system substrate-binding protein [Solirubrobacterales bacterium]|jgi:phospholipid/cholesterol/gamma-HCH transport system substrate-binding protein|nr:phospholipid/cholesterol/gamma-HCH transport system substrate-binding protein [Solirubrobacterales bacterium]
MKRVIRDHLRDFVAILCLATFALAISFYIFQEQRLRIPILEEKPFELQAEFETAQAVVPGQGQTVRVAGVDIGEVKEVELVDGHGVISFEIERQYLPVYRNATILMRPTTGLKDMFFDLDPGSSEAGEFEEGETIPMTNTLPDVNLDEVLEALDSDTQAYLRMLLVGAGEGLDGNAKRLGKLLGTLGPIQDDLSTLNKEVSKRREELAITVHSFNLLMTRVGKVESELTRLVTSSRTALGAIAERDPDVQRFVARLPGTLTQAETTLNNLAELGEVLGPTFNSLRPFARNLPELNESNIQLAESSTPVVRDQIRPFVRAAREPIPDLRKAATRFGEATPHLRTSFSKLNRLANMAAFNPNGAEPAGTAGRDEGYLFWAGWLGHNTASIYSAGDGNGYYRRIYLSMGCEQLNDLVSDPNPIVQQLTQLVTGFTNAVIAQACP